MDGLVVLLFVCLGAHRVLGAIADNVTCTQNLWLNNGLGQSPCYVFAELMGQCYEGNFTITSDGTGNGVAFKQPGPLVLDDECWCSTVQYNLLSACYSCLNYTSFSWSGYIQECDSRNPTIGVPGFALPAGVDIPAYAMIQDAQDWNLALAEQIHSEGIPDTNSSATLEVFVGGTTVITIPLTSGAKSSSTSSVTSSTSMASTPTTHSLTSSSSIARSGTLPITAQHTGPGPVTLPSTTSSPLPSSSSPADSNPAADAAAPPSKSSPMRAIIGGAVGGGLFLLALLAVIVVLCRRRNQRRSEYRVSLITSAVKSPPPPSPAPWFPPMPTPAPPPMSHTEPHSFRSSLYALGGDAVPYLSSITTKTPSRSMSGNTEWDEKRAMTLGEENAGGKWVQSAYGYSCPEQWSPLPAYPSNPSAGPQAFGGKEKKDMYPPAGQP